MKESYEIERHILIARIDVLERAVQVLALNVLDLQTKLNQMQVERCSGNISLQ